MSPDLAARIVDRRSTAPFSDPSEITGIAGLETVGIALQGKLVVKGTIFRVQSRAQVRDTVRIVEAVVRVDDAQPTLLYWREL